MIAEEMERRAGTGATTLRQVADATGKQMGGVALFDAGGRAFRIKAGSASAGGVLEASGRLDEGRIEVDLLMAEVPEAVWVRGSVFRELRVVTEDASLDLAESKRGPGVVGIVCRMHLDGAPMGPATETAFSNRLANLREAAVRVREKIPESVRDLDLESKWSAMGNTVSVVCPVMSFRDAEEMRECLRGVSNCLLSGCNVALAAERAISSSLILDFLASWGKKLGITLAEVGAGQVTPDQVVAMATKAPGSLVVPALKLAIGANSYNLAKESSSMLASLGNCPHPVVFTGSMAELQGVFSGGQGGSSDPLNPVPVRVPEELLPFETMVRFALKKRAETQGGISPKEENALCQEILRALGDMPEEDRRKILPMAVSRTFRLSRLGLCSKATPLKEAMEGFVQAKESFGGLGNTAKTDRSTAVQQKVLSRLTDPGLPELLNERIVGQRKAVGQILDKLRNDILLGSADKPLVVMVVGPSGTGKSFCCKTLAGFLGMPHVWFNAGQYGSIHTVDSILNGVPLGYVGSYKKGKKERCAGNPDGALLEVSDLDHASSAVRHYLADSFLEDIDTGRSQTASGAEFSTAGIVFFFTVNLPYGLDEKLGRRTGFGPSPESDEIGLKAYEELKKLFSNAFLARVGQPVVFAPLDDEACAAIAERAVGEAVANSVRNLGMAVGDIVLAPGLGRQIMENARLMKASMGARALVKYARSRVSDAVLKLKTEKCRNADLRMSIAPGGKIRIQLKKRFEKEVAR